MDGELQLPEPAAAEALANFEAFLDATPELGVVLAQDKGDTLLRAMKKRFAATKRIRTRQCFAATAYHCTACGGWHITGHSKASRSVKNRNRDKARGK